MSNEIIERLELKLAFVERANQELSDVVYRQQQQIDALQVRLQAMASRIESLGSPDRPWTEDEEKPPHY